MTQVGFATALAFTLSAEGGFTSADGTPTNMGVQQGTYDKWLKSHGAQSKPITQITAFDAQRLYQEWYWEPCSCDSLPYPLGVCVFDTAVNSGQDEAIRLLQRAVWVDEDGIVGPGTLAAAKAGDAYCHAYAYITLRRQADLAIKGSDAFYRGWLNRCVKLEAHIEESRG